MSINDLLEADLTKLEVEDTDDVKTAIIKQLLYKAAKGDNSMLKLVADNIIFTTEVQTNKPIEIKVI